jgi:hypothetical protein
MALRSALKQRRREARTPLRASSWSRHLARYDLLDKHGHLVDKIRFGFLLDIHPITSTFVPLNPASANRHTPILLAEH